MAGTGTYVAFNKERVGVYTRFEAKKASDFINTDTIGTVAIGLPMDYGKDGDVIEVLGTELEDGSCLSKIGYTLNDDAILPYRLALTGAYRAYFYKLNKGGEKATGTLGDITVKAKYTGILGNNIKLVVTANTPTAGKFCIEIYFNDIKKETIYATTGKELLEKNSAWVDFTSTLDNPTITPTTGLTLAGGTNGTISSTSSDGAYASVEIGSLKFTAKNIGATGNNIGITIEEDSSTSLYTLKVLVNDEEKENFTDIPDIAGFLAKGSSYVAITNPSGSTITTATNTKLSGGIDAITSSYDDFFTAVKYKMYDYIAIAGADTVISDKVVEFVNKQREQKGKYVCGVVYNKPMLNNKYIISVDQGIECEDFVITEALMPIFVASLRAGCPLGQCLDNNDMTKLIGAKRIINEINDDGDDAFIAALKQGKFLFAYWNDGTVVVEEDINTYVEYVENDPINFPADYRRNRLIATMNYIGNESQSRLNRNVVDGKHADDDEGNTRYLVKSIVDDVCTQLRNATVIGNYDPQTDITVGSAGASDRLQYKTYLSYKDSIRQVYGEYNIVLS